MEDLVFKLTGKDNLKLLRETAMEYYKKYDEEKCRDMALEFYGSEYFQVQELGVFLMGYISPKSAQALEFLKSVVSKHPSWKVQEVLAMAFDAFCKGAGYEQSIPTIKEWLNSDNENVRRAVIEGLRIWTSRPYFKENPDKAISIIAQFKGDNSEYVRKSVGNSLRDISKKHPDLVLNELKKWELSSKEVKQVYKLAVNFLVT